MSRVSTLVMAFLVALAAGVPAGAKPSESAVEGKVPATMLMFQEQSKGTKPQRTRMLITDRYVRSDGGGGGENFVLFDRQEETIYSVSHRDSTILVIPPREVKVDSPMELDLGESHQVQKDAPKVGDQQVVHHRFTVNDKDCRNVMAVEGMLDDAVAAMRSFREVLAGEHAKNMNRTPPDMQKACSLANNIFAPVRHLEYGFPIREWDYRGHSRALVDYNEDFRAKPALFDLPDDYRRYTTEDIVNGQM